MATINIGSIKFKWQGAYNGATAYTVDDVVSYNGSSYICIANSTGNLPTNTSYFEQMSAKGTDGTNGTNGTDLTTTLTTQGDIVYRDGSGLQRLGAGTAGQVLQTGGAGANPQWSTVSSDFVKLLSTSTSGSTTINIDGYFTSDYDRYMCFLSNMHYEGSNDGNNLKFRFRRSNADVTSADYCSATVRAYNDGSSVGPYAWTNWNQDNGYISELSSSLTYSSNLEITFHNPLETNASPVISTRISGWHGTSYMHGGAGCVTLNGNVGAISGFSLIGVGNMTIKKVTLYGIKD